MRPGYGKSLTTITLVSSGLVLSGTFISPSRGDEPPRFGLGRLFRSGGGSPGSAATSTPSPTTPNPYAPSLLPPPATASSPDAGAGPSTRLVPQPRNSRPATESDPILTRVAVNRADNSGQFCDVLQVYADGTVLDSGGIHHLGQEAIRPLVNAIQSGDAYRLKGHCGGPPTDFVEQVHIIVYERSLGRLKANSFSYSGNPQGCDPAIRNLQVAIEALQTKLSGPPTLAPATPSAPAPEIAPAHAQPIPLTPLD